MYKGCDGLDAYFVGSLKDLEAFASLDYAMEN